jgi:hypothetical protein
MAGPSAAPGATAGLYSSGVRLTTTGRWPGGRFGRLGDAVTGGVRCTAHVRCRCEVKARVSRFMVSSILWLFGSLDAQGSASASRLRPESCRKPLLRPGDQSGIVPLFGGR